MSDLQSANSNTELRSLTDIEAARVEVVVLRALRKALIDGDVGLAVALAQKHDELLKAALLATTLFVNGHPEVEVPLVPHS